MLTSFGSQKTVWLKSKRLHAARETSATRTLGCLHVALLPGERFRARLVAGTTIIPCVLGPNGITRRKREGDGATPAGCFALVRVMFRSDRGPPPRSALPRRPLRPKDGWCDEPRRSCYNRPVVLPFDGGHERLWRDDRLYDVIVVIDFNLRPTRPGRGSAIFMHVASAPVGPTAGCVAMSPKSLRRLLARVGPRTRITFS